MMGRKITRFFFGEFNLDNELISGCFYHDNSENGPTLPSIFGGFISTENQRKALKKLIAIREDLFDKFNFKSVLISLFGGLSDENLNIPVYFRCLFTYKFDQNTRA